MRSEQSSGTTGFNFDSGELLMAQATNRDSQLTVQRTSMVSALILGTIVVDQAVKVLARHQLQGREPILYFDGMVRLQYAENAGAFLSFGSLLNSHVRFWASVAIALFLTWLIWGVLIKRSQMDQMTSVGITLLVAGGYANLIDRFWRGSVTDFLNLGIGQLRTGIFNVADVIIVIGVALLLANSFLRKPQAQT
jgi:signal peptidase II